MRNYTITGRSHPASLGFTIVEMATVIAIMGLLAIIGFVSVEGWRTKVATKEVLSDLNGVEIAMKNARNFDNVYPTSLPSTFKGSKNTLITYTSGNAQSYCIDVSSKKITTIKYFLKTSTTGEVDKPRTGTCIDGETTP